MIDYSKGVIVEASEELENSRSHYSGNNQLSKVDVGSPSLPANDTELFDCHIAKLFVASKRARLDIQACVASLFTKMKLPRNYYKDRHLNIDLLFVHKTQILLMLFWKGRFMYFKTLLSKHNKYIQNKLRQFIQSQRLQNIFTIVGGVSRIELIGYIVIYIDLIKYMVDSQVYISNGTIQVMNDLMKKEVKPEGRQCYNIHHESILLVLFTNGDIYENDSYASYVD